jgi:glycosyltransferase involved in cell wall biosynthesis
MNPDITVIVPYHNEKESIEFTLERVGGQTLPAKAAIFVNSSSTDDTFDVVDNWIRKNQHKFPTRFFNIFENTDNPASSKNAGIRRASTDWIAFMDCGQNFQKDWLELQLRRAQETGANVVSGVVYLTGENWIDRCATVQTYGYKRLRPCLPTSLIRRSVFEKTGLLTERRRAGYDAAWLIRLKKLGLHREINYGVVISYIGTNFARTLAQVFRKSMLYAKASVGLEGYHVPYLYAVMSALFLVVLVNSAAVASFMFLLYFLARTFVLPIWKSRNVAFFREHPFEALLGSGIIGAIIDLGRLLGTWQGIHCHYLKGRPTNA